MDKLTLLELARVHYSRILMNTELLLKYCIASGNDNLVDALMTINERLGYITKKLKEMEKCRK